MALGFDTVSNDLPIAFPGMQSGAGPRHIDSFVNSEASAEMRFGICVAQGATDKAALLLAATTDKLVGVTCFRHGYVDTIQLGTNGIKPKVVLGVEAIGERWVVVEEDVTPASDVYVRAVATGAEIAGAFRDTADGADTINVSKFCRFVSSSTLAPDGTTKVAKLRFDFTNRGA
jgi:hypothetical protein